MNDNTFKKYILIDREVWFYKERFGSYRMRLKCFTDKENKQF